LITHYIYSACGYILYLRIILASDVRLAIIIIRIIYHYIQVLRKFAAQLLLYNSNVILYLFRNIARQLAASIIIMINTEVLGIEILPVKGSVLNPVLAKRFYISLRNCSARSA